MAINNQEYKPQWSAWAIGFSFTRHFGSMPLRANKQIDAIDAQRLCVKCSHIHFYKLVKYQRCKSDTFVKVPDIQIEAQLPTPMSVCWRKYSKPTVNLGYGPLTCYVKLRVAHAPGMPGTFSPPPTSKENHYLGTPACITARASRTCRDACRDR